ncbi:MAG: hypothetical protein KatS3mg002_0133 [Candidatus Woesearchaeota archaeon]|nr:MAG: hypothetical protein KatS3mg002_0133 [Candidatus Woesearchaeota archaeon]
MDEKKLEKIVHELEKGIPSGRINLGGQQKKGIGDAIYIPYLDDKTIYAPDYAEGTSIPAGSVGINAFYDKNGNPVWDAKDADLSRGVLVHKEVAKGGETYAHWLFYIDKNEQIHQIATFNDYYGQIIPIEGSPRGNAQIWYFFSYRTNTLDYFNFRRHIKNKQEGDWIIMPFKKVYHGGHPNPPVPMENGLVYYDTKNKDTLIIEKISETTLPNLYGSRGKINFKKDVLTINGTRMIETSGWIDIVKIEGKKAYLDISTIIDMYYTQVGGLYVFSNANPTDPEDEYLNNEYKKQDYQAGPQMKHEIKVIDLETKKLIDKASFTDSTHSGYEHYSMPADKGIIVVSRKTGKKEHIY